MTSDDVLLDRLQYQVALFSRRVEQVRVPGSGAQRTALDRAAFLLLNRLNTAGTLGVKALAEAMGIDSSTVTRQVAPLVDAGLVDRVQNPDDKRAVFLALSPLGRQRLREVRRSRQDLMRRVLADWPDADAETFCTLLSRFNDSLQALPGERSGTTRAGAPQGRPARREPLSAGS